MVFETAHSARFSLRTPACKAALNCADNKPGKHKRGAAFEIRLNISQNQFWRASQPQTGVKKYGLYPAIL
jgi:hypothetical protein